jgi:hypothetical protein
MGELQSFTHENAFQKKRFADSDVIAPHVRAMPPCLRVCVHRLRSDDREAFDLAQHTKRAAL